MEGVTGPGKAPTVSKLKNRNRERAGHTSFLARLEKNTQFWFCWFVIKSFPSFWGYPSRIKVKSDNEECPGSVTRFLYVARMVR